MRRARPARETVADEVEAALAREVAHLASITQQLTDKVCAWLDACASLGSRACVQMHEYRLASVVHQRAPLACATGTTTPRLLGRVLALLLNPNCL